MRRAISRHCSIGDDVNMALPVFIQISDLHMSVASEEERKRRKQSSHQWRLFQGLLGHSENSLCYLDDFIHAMRQEEPDLQLIVTGDLTSIGHEEEFGIAEKFISAAYQPAKGGEVGLG